MKAGRWTTAVGGLLLAALGLGGCVAVEEAGPVYTGSSAPLVLDGENAGPVAWQAFDMLDGLDMDMTGMLAELPITARTVSAEDKAGAKTMAGPLARLQRILAVLPELRAASRALPAGVVHQGWLACHSGGIRWTADQALSGAVTAGDRYMLDFVACEDAGVILDGRVVVAVDAASGIPGESGYHLSGTARFETLAFTAIDDGSHGLQDGLVRFDESWNAGVRSVRASGPDLYLRCNGEQFLLTDFEFLARDDGLARTYSADFVLRSTIPGGRIEVTTLLPFTAEGRFPWQGSLLIRGALGTWVRLDAEPDARNVTVAWAFVPADDMAQGIETVAWLDLPFWRPLGW